MIPFKTICEFLTHKQTLSWFYWDKDLLPALTEEDLKLVFIEDIKEPDIVRLWYPKEKFTEKPLFADEFKRLVAKAIEKEDWVEVQRLKQRLKKG